MSPGRSMNLMFNVLPADPPLVPLWILPGGSVLDRSAMTFRMNSYNVSHMLYVLYGSNDVQSNVSNSEVRVHSELNLCSDGQ